MDYEQQHARYANDGTSRGEEGHWAAAPSSPYQQHSSAHQHGGGGYGSHHHPGYSAATYGTSYAPTYGGHLPPPNSSYQRVSTNPGDYRHHSSSYGYGNVTSPEMHSGPWSPAMTVSSYDPYYTHEDEGSEITSSGEGSPVPIKAEETTTPLSTSPQPGTSGSDPKKYKCYRVSPSTGETCRKAFKRKADLQRHESTVHDKHKTDRMDCPYKKCARKAESGFLRKDHLTEHLRHFHNRDIPKKGRRGSSVNDNRVEEVVDEQSLARHYPQYPATAYYQEGGEQ